MSTAAVKSIPTRKEIPVEDTWDLTRLYEDDQAWEKDFKKLESLIPGYPERKGTLGKSAEALRAFFGI
jgi:oligoendopeptidase F